MSALARAVVLSIVQSKMYICKLVNDYVILTAAFEQSAWTTGIG